MISSCKFAVRSFIESYSFGVKNSKILDIGCGDGEYTSLFCKNNNKVVGIDVRNYVNPVFKKFEFIQANAEKLPFSDNSFNLVISFDVIEHIKDDEKAIKEIYRVLKPGGRIFLETPNKERLSYYLLKLIGKKRKYPLKLGDKCVHLREYTKKELVLKFKMFKDLKITPFWIGLRGSLELGFLKPPKLLEKFCQCFFIEGKK